MNEKRVPFFFFPFLFLFFAGITFI